ncbi:MAG TPA: class I adenylate-forming enzyme family protein [Miltoncostaeaceae bacterium]|nr:class I adenylate-forming enzyme family protein [Miltoncostaeaceae bacterium]
MIGVTLDIDVEAAALRHPERLALTVPEGRLTYGDLAERSDRAAAGLAASGIARGDRVAVLLPNGWQAVVAVQAVMRAGAALVPLNPTLKADRLAQILGDAGARGLITDSRSLGLVAEARAIDPSLPAPAGMDERLGDAPSLLERGDGARPPAARPLGSDLAALIYTSGSTGRPKGVTLSHANMAFTVGSIATYLEVRPDDVTLSALSLSYGYGLYQALCSWRVGARLVLERGVTFPGRIVQLLESEQVTMLPGVPTIFGLLTGLPGIEERELPALRAITNAGAALPEALLRRIRDVFPDAAVFAMYGQTEAQRIAYMPPGEIERRPRSVGVAIPGTEVWVRSEDGGEAAPGEVGELIVRGPHVMQGYWNAPEATERRLERGAWPWERVLATGDLFYRDEEGFLFFVARQDDIVKSRGEKVAPREVEEVLCEVPGVRDAAVVGVSDPILGQALHAHVAPADAIRMDERGMQAFCAQHLEAHKVPQRITVHDELPTNGSNKVDRLALKALGEPSHA